MASFADVDAVDLARKFIRKRYKKVIKRGRAITEDTPYDVFHSLRIDCKKLRYLLEFFASLFPANKMILLIGQLKK
jgi:CHAD domain-containing protein